MTPEELAALAQKSADLVHARLIADAKGQREALANEQKTAAKLAKGAGLGRFALVAAASKGNGAVALNVAKAFGFSDVEKALQESNFTAGGSLIPPEYSSEFIELLRPASVLQELGAVYTPFKSELIIGKAGGGVTAAWVGEGAAIPKSQLATAQIKLQAHKLGILTEISNDLLRNPQAGADARATADMLDAARIAFDLAGISGDGGGAKPKGVLNLMDQGQKVARTGSGTATDQITDIDKAVRIVDQTNRSRQKRGWLFDPIEEAKLLSLRDAAGWIFRDEMLLRGTLRGFPYKTTTNMTAGVRVFGEWSDLYWGVDQDVVVDHFPGADIAADVSSIRLIMRGDFQTKRAASWFATTGN